MKECPICHTCFGDRMEICNNDKSLLLDLIPGLPVINNKYRLDKKIGMGRVGIVFQATVMQTGETVAIKIISPNLVIADPTLPERFLTLIRDFATLDHVNIVKVFDFGQEEPNILYFVMEYLPSPTLAELLQQQKQLSIEAALGITSKVCEAIANANRNGVYHLDLKPTNIFVRNGDNGQQIVKVVDFGIVRLKVPSLISQLSPMQRDYVLGKPYYSAPEQFSSEQIDPRSEVYAIGAILYHLLAGNPPFTGGSYPMLKMQHMGVTPPSLREIRPEILPTVESIIIKALEKRSTQRHSSVIALAVQLSAQLAKHKEFLLSQSNNTLPALPSPPEPFYSNDPTPAPVNKYTTRNVKTVSENALNPLQQPQEDYSDEPTLSPVNKYLSKAILDDVAMMGAADGLEQTQPTKTPTKTPRRESQLRFNLDDTASAFPSSSEDFYSNNPTPLPITAYSPNAVLNNTLDSLPDPPEPFYSSDPTPPPIKPSSSLLKLEETLGAFPNSSESNYSEEFTSTSNSTNNPSRENFLSDLKLEETLGAFSESDDPFHSRDLTPIPETDTVYSQAAEDSVNRFGKPRGATEPVYSVPGLIAPTLLIAEGNVVTRPLASESFFIGEQFDEVSPNSIYEEVQIFEQADIDQAFEQAGIGESAERTTVSKFLELPAELSSLSTEIYQLSPSAIVYLFVEQFVPALLSGQRGRQMHNNFATERERLAALLLVTALFSLSCRGVIEISVGSGSPQKKQIALSQKNEGFIIRAVNLEAQGLDILESKIIDSLKLAGTTRFYNIFLYIAQTSVATSEREAICEIVADIIADELVIHGFLQSKQKTRRLESGESAIQYECACDLSPYRNQALSIQDWLQSLQQQATIELAGKPIQPFIHILKYYTDLFRHNSKELSKS